MDLTEKLLEHFTELNNERYLDAYLHDVSEFDSDNDYDSVITDLRKSSNVYTVKGLPPTLIGGQNSQSEGTTQENVVGVDWLQGTIPFSKMYALAAYIYKVVGVEPVLKEYGQNRYNRTAEFEPYGIKIFFDDTEQKCIDVHAGRVTIVIPGTALGIFSKDDLHLLFRDLVFKGTRIDLNYDDYTRLVTPSEIAEDARKGNFTGFKRIDHRRPEKMINGKMVITGDTLYFGRRGKNGSGKYVRIYDKNLESKGEKNCIRYETEFSKERAAAVVLELAKSSDSDSMAIVIGSLIGGSISFIDRRALGKDKNVSRAKLLPWWQEVVEFLGTIKLRNKKKIQTVEGSEKWVREVVAPTMAMLWKVKGDEDFATMIYRMVSHGEIRLKDKHFKMIEAYYEQLEPDETAPF